MPRFASETANLLTNAAATGSGVGFGGGPCHFILIAGSGGGTTALQALGPDGSTWIAVAGASSATSTIVALNLPSGTYRASVSGGTPAGIYCQLKGLPG